MSSRYEDFAGAGERIIVVAGVPFGTHNLRIPTSGAGPQMRSHNFNVLSELPDRAVLLFGPTATE